MKFMIGVDLEGLACVVGSPNKVLTETRNYEFACRQAVREANAAARALFDMGAQEVIVWDNHGASLNMMYEDIDRRCSIVLGCDFEHRWPGMDSSFNGVLMIGYHPMDNTVNGVLAHTFSSKEYQWIKINGQEVGEIAIDAAIAGDMGVPLIFVASDDKGVAEAKRFTPWSEGVETKKGMGWNLALSKHPLNAADEIYEGVKNAVKRIGQMENFGFGSPVTMEVRYKRPDTAQSMVTGKTGWRFIDAYTVEKTYTSLNERF